MRDVIKALPDTPRHATSRPARDILEILSIESRTADLHTAARSQDVVDYLIRRERQLEGLSARDI